MEHRLRRPFRGGREGKGPSPALLEEVLTEAGIPVFPGAADALARHAEEMLRWNRSIRLTAIADPVGVAVKHVADSLLLLRFAPFPGRLLDFGSGSGYPGIPLAIYLPGTRITLVESSVKKCAFLSRVRGMLSLGNVEVVHARLGGPKRAAIPPQDHIVTRATAPPGELLDLLSPYLVEGGRFLFLQGPRGDHDLPDDGTVRPVCRMERFSLPRRMGERVILEVEPSPRDSGIPVQGR